MSRSILRRIPPEISPRASVEMLLTRVVSSLPPSHTSRLASTIAKAQIPNKVQQVSTDGEVRRFDGNLAGSMRSASVTVDGVAEGPLSTLLRAGTFDGTILSDCRFEVGALNPL